MQLSLLYVAQLEGRGAETPCTPQQLRLLGVKDPIRTQK